ncbi:MAG: hypothetical protein ACJAQT_002447 [Akkermansiaceae bacterium]|jgi:hypothetical protein
MMNTSSSRIFSLLMALSVLLTSISSAHPGPEGHTHPDEWPFEMLAYLMLALGAAWVCRLMWKKN